MTDPQAFQDAFMAAVAAGLTGTGAVALRRRMRELGDDCTLPVIDAIPRGESVRAARNRLFVALLWVCCLVAIAWVALSAGRVVGSPR